MSERGQVVERVSLGGQAGGAAGQISKHDGVVNMAAASLTNEAVVKVNHASWRIVLSHRVRLSVPGPDIAGTLEH